MFNSYVNASLNVCVGLTVFLLGAGNVQAAPDTSEDLTKAFAFGETLTPNILQESPFELNLGNDSIVGRPPVVPYGMAKSGKAGDSGTVIGGETETATEDSEKDNVSTISIPSGPLDDFGSAVSNKEVNERLTEMSNLSTAYYTLGALDPLYPDALAKANTLGTNFSNNVNQARERMVAEYQQSGAAGRMRLMGLKNCENEAAKATGDEAESAYPALACISSRLGSGTGADTGSGFGPRSATTRASTRAVLDDDKAALQACGFSSSSAVEASSKCEAEAQKVLKGSVEIIAAIRNSYNLYPKITGEGAEKQDKLRTDYQQYFGDQCLVCVRGGKSELGIELDKSTARLKIVELAPSIKLADHFVELNKAVYDNLRKILYNKCYHDNYDRSSEKPTEKKGAEIFRLESASKDGVTKTLYNDGNFWYGDAASGTNADNRLGGGISAKVALGYLSFNGFKLTPAIMDGLYDIVTQKNSISELGKALAGGGYENKECDTRLGTELAWDKINPVLSDPEAKDKVLSVKREIRALYNLAKRITLGKVFDGCQQALAKTQMVNIDQELGSQAIKSIIKVCSGDAGDPSAFMRQRGENIAQINEFVEGLFRELAADSGKSGSSVTKAFKNVKTTSP